MLVRDIAARNARLRPDRPALLDENGPVSHAELALRAQRAAAVLRGAGIGKGDRVAALARPSPRAFELFFAAAQVGAVLVPLNPQFVARELRAVLSASESKMALYDGEFRGKADEVRGALSPGADVLCLDDGDGNDPSLPSLASRAAPLPPSAVPLEDEDIAMLVYTPGPDGKSRGAMLSNRNLVAAASAGARSLALTGGEVSLSCLPFPCLSQAGWMLAFLFAGGTVAFLRDPEPERLLGAVERRRVTHVLLGASAMAGLSALPAPHRFDLASLRTVIHDGASLPVDLLVRTGRLFGCGMVQAYGPVESTGVLTFLAAGTPSPDPAAPSPRNLRSIGREAPGVEIRIVDEGGSELPPGAVGEIAARGPNVFRGYRADPRATADVMRDGWLRTGDVAMMDEDRYVYVVDRSRDILTVGGHPVSPREIEEILLSHGAVQEAAVIGRADYEWGEVPVAVVTRKEGATADREALFSHCRVNLAPFKVPRMIEFVPALPRNSQGKVLKAKLRGGPAPALRRPRP